MYCISYSKLPYEGDKNYCPMKVINEGYKNIPMKGLAVDVQIAGAFTNNLETMACGLLGFGLLWLSYLDE